MYALDTAAALIPVVVQLYQLGVEMLYNLCHQHCGQEVPPVSTGPRNLQQSCLQSSEFKAHPHRRSPLRYCALAGKAGSHPPVLTQIWGCKLCTTGRLRTQPVDSLPKCRDRSTHPRIRSFVPAAAACCCSLWQLMRGRSDARTPMWTPISRSKQCRGSGLGI